MGATVDWSWFTSAGAFAVAMSATPGPNNMMVAASGANYGFRASLPHLLGICIGFPVMLLAIGTVGLPLIGNPVVHAALKWIGIIYLLWLAWKIGSAEPSIATGEKPGVGRAGKPLTFVQAALFQWVNPKAWSIAAGALAAFAIVEDGGSPIMRTIALAAIFGILAFPCVAVWTMLGMGASRLFATRRAMRNFNMAMAALLVLSLIPSISGMI